jgi:hypothetical protein
VDTLELFPELTPSARANGDGYTKPIGRRRARRSQVRRARPSSVGLLVEIRSLLEHQLGGVRLSLQRIERHARNGAESQAAAAEALEGMRLRLTQVERHLGIVEMPETPRVSRRRPLQ